MDLFVSYTDPHTNRKAIILDGVISGYSDSVKVIKTLDGDFKVFNTDDKGNAFFIHASVFIKVGTKQGYKLIKPIRLPMEEFSKGLTFIKVLEMLGKAGATLTTFGKPGKTNLEAGLIGSCKSSKTWWPSNTEARRWIRDGVISLSPYCEEDSETLKEIPLWETFKLTHDNLWGPNLTTIYKKYDAWVIQWVY